MEIKDFYVDMDAVKLANINSLLVDSDTTIASLLYNSPSTGEEEEIFIEVKGDVKIFFDGNYYYTASEFPNELKEILRLSPVDRPDNFEIIDNNWCELFYTINGNVESDFDVVDGEFGETEAEIKQYLIDMVNYIEEHK